MKASGAIYGKTVQEQRHDIACKGPGIAPPTFLRSASFGGIGVLLFMVGSISACSTRLGTSAASVQTTVGGWYAPQAARA
jgi:hypothetical protein